MGDESSNNRIAGRSIKPKHQLSLICAVYFIMSAVFGSMNLDIDEFTFVREPYELLGGDYTRRYLAENDFRRAATTILKSYYFYWKYRPLFSPIIDEGDRDLFQREEKRFGYTKQEPVQRHLDPDVIAKYSQRLIVPEPDKFYTRGAGKPLLPALLSIPQLGLVQLLTSDSRNLVFLQHTYNYHPIFILVRLVQILSGFVTILLVYWILAKEYDATRALLGASIMAVFPLSISYFPNLHQDAILVPFVLLTAYSFYKQQYMMAGVFFGLALASKNTAIILAPALLAYVIWDAYAADKSAMMKRQRRPLVRGTRDWAIVMLVGGLVLLPFANPISFTSEILTPITKRQYDPRGEDVNSFTVAGRLHRPEGPEAKYVYRSASRPEVRLINLISGFRDIGFLFIALAALCLFSRQNRPLARMCLLVLMLSLPYGLVFGHDLSYRALMFVPFLAILSVDVARKRPLLCLVGLLLLIDVVYCLDPMTVDTMHYPANKDTFVSALLGRMGVR